MLGIIICSFFLKLDFNTEEIFLVKEENQICVLDSASTLNEIKNIRSFYDNDSCVFFTNLKPFEKQKFINHTLNTNIY